MHLAMNAHIVFPKVRDRELISIRKPNSIKIETGWEMLTDHASIIMARHVRYFDNTKVKTVFKPGDPVVIYLGYNGDLIKEFTGFITEVSAETPIKIKCQDYMYMLKKAPVNISLRKTNLPALIKQIAPGVKHDVLDVDIGTQRFVNTTVAKVLEFLQEEYSIYSYIKNGDTLVVGKIYSDDTEITNYDFKQNIVQNNLQYRNKEDVLIKINGISTLPNGDKIEYSFGDENGDIQDLSYYNIALIAELKKLVKLDYDKYKIDGLNGRITTWGIPSVKHGFKARLNSDESPDRNGLYYIKKVTKTFDDSPKYRQVLEFDKKAQ